jgi:hypothetical protein
MAFFPIKILETAMEYRMFGHAEKIWGGDVIPGRGEEYNIWQDERVIEKAQTYDEATRKGKVVKRVIQRRRSKFNTTASQ